MTKEDTERILEAEAEAAVEEEPEDEDAEVSDDGQDDSDDPSATVLVMGPDGKPMGAMAVDAETGEAGDPAKLVEQPAKVMRVGSMVKQLLEEVRNAPLDEAGRQRLRAIHARSIAELEEGLAPELRDELERLTLPFNGDDAPSEGELRIAQAQLVGWLEGLFHGIQAALMAQQMAARMQLEQMRRGIPAGALPPGGQVTPDMVQMLSAGGDDEDGHGPGQYL
ncbi:MAG: bacterial proteasome activator family protein [Stackebrandtia sp.]